MAKPIIFEDHKASYEDQRLALTMRDGQVFTIDPPALWPDDIYALSQANDILGLAKAILGGNGQYERFVEAGGTAGILGDIIEKEFGSTVPELRASSSS